MFPMSVPLSAGKAQAIELLRRQIRSSQSAGDRQEFQPTGLSALDRLLPGGGIPVGSVMEWISETPGHSATSLALRCASALLKRPGCLAVVDEGRDFFPAIAPALNVPLSRILLVRVSSGTRASSVKPRTYEGRTSKRSASPTDEFHSESLWALEQASRCRGVRVAIGWLDRCTSSVVRRLQLAVEHSGVTVMLIRPATALTQPSFADLRLKVRTLPTAPGQHSATDSQPGFELLAPRRVQVQLMKVRQGLQCDGTAELTQDWSERFSG
jgi:hypothetical protein